MTIASASAPSASRSRARCPFEIRPRYNAAGEARVIGSNSAPPKGLSPLIASEALRGARPRLGSPKVRHQSRCATDAVTAAFAHRAERALLRKFEGWRRGEELGQQQTWGSACANGGHSSIECYGLLFGIATIQQRNRLLRTDKLFCIFLSVSRLTPFRVFPDTWSISPAGGRHRDDPALRQSTSFL